MPGLTLRGVHASKVCMELAAVIIAAILGWQTATLGKRELKVMAIVIAGWTAVTTAASIPYLTVESVLVSLVLHAMLVAFPFIAAMGVRRIIRR